MHKQLIFCKHSLQYKKKRKKEANICVSVKQPAIPNCLTVMAELSAFYVNSLYTQLLSCCIDESAVCTHYDVSTKASFTLARVLAANSPSHWRERKVSVICMLLAVYVALKSFSTK